MIDGDEWRPCGLWERGVAGYDQDSADLPPPFSLPRELTNHVQQHHGHPTRSKRNKKADWIINFVSLAAAIEDHLLWAAEKKVHVEKRRPERNNIRRRRVWGATLISRDTRSNVSYGTFALK
eukprot:scaffold611091_cov94-Attheya_sp.AAC.1